MDGCCSFTEYMDAYVQLWCFSGVVSVTRGGEIAFSGAYGRACHEFSVDNTMDTRFTLASVSKQFTAFAIMQLYDAGALELNRPANLYLPEELRVDDRITVSHLLSHTSGLHQIYSFECDFFMGGDRTLYDRKWFYENYISLPMAFEPGARYEYNNVGYFLLAAIIENLSGMSFGAYLQSRIFDEIGMVNTCLDDGVRVIPNRAFNYLRHREEVARAPYYNERYSEGAGAVVSNAADLKLWYECLRDRRLLSAKAYGKLLSENLCGYCYGLVRDEVHGRVRYSHRGDHLAIMTYVQYFFEDDLCIVVLSNDECGSAHAVGEALAEIHFTGSADRPERPVEVELDEIEAAELEGVYLEGKIEIRRESGRLYFVRLGGGLYISLCPIGEGRYVRRYAQQGNPYDFARNERGLITFQGYERSVP